MSIDCDDLDICGYNEKSPWRIWCARGFLLVLMDFRLLFEEFYVAYAMDRLCVPVGVLADGTDDVEFLVDYN